MVCVPPNLNKLHLPLVLYLERVLLLFKACRKDLLYSSVLHNANANNHRTALYSVTRKPTIDVVMNAPTFLIGIRKLACVAVAAVNMVAHIYIYKYMMVVNIYWSHAFLIRKFKWTLVPCRFCGWLFLQS